jgi:hypothetical protein
VTTQAQTITDILLKNPNLTIEKIKNEARKLKKDHEIKHSAALEIVAKSYGFANYNQATHKLSPRK